MNDVTVNEYGWDWATPIPAMPDMYVMAELAAGIRRDRLAREACFILRCMIELDTGMLDDATDNGH